MIEGVPAGKCPVDLDRGERVEHSAFAAHVARQAVQQTAESDRIETMRVDLDRLARVANKSLRVESVKAAGAVVEAALAEVDERQPRGRARIAAIDAVSGADADVGMARPQMFAVDLDEALLGAAPHAIREEAHDEGVVETQPAGGIDAGWIGQSVRGSGRSRFDRRGVHGCDLRKPCTVLASSLIDTEGKLKNPSYFGALRCF